MSEIKPSTNCFGGNVVPMHAGIVTQLSLMESFEAAVQILNDFNPRGFRQQSEYKKYQDIILFSEEIVAHTQIPQAQIQDFENATIAFFVRNISNFDLIDINDPLQVAEQIDYLKIALIDDYKDRAARENLLPKNFQRQQLG